MSANTSEASLELRPVQFSRLTKRGLLLGLSLPQLLVLATALGIIVTGLYTGGGQGLAWSSPAWASLVVIAWVPVGGRKLIEWAPIVTRWLLRTRAKQTQYRRRVVKPRCMASSASPSSVIPWRRRTTSRISSSSR